MNGLLKISQVSKSFGGVKALDCVQMEFLPGKVLGIVGPNGAGKTTLFNVISGIYRPDQGTVWYGDLQIDNAPLQTISRLGIKRTFQTPRVFSNLPVLTNVLLGGAINHRRIMARSFFLLRTEGWEHKETVSTAMSILGELGIQQKANDLAGELSFGEQKLLEISRASIANPKILLLDEPSAGLNEQRQEAVLQKIKSFQQGGITIVIIEHNIQFLLNCVDTLFVLTSGKIFGTFARNEINKVMLHKILGLW